LADLVVPRDDDASDLQSAIHSLLTHAAFHRGAAALYDRSAFDGEDPEFPTVA
jgi:hypothetical protein